MAVAETEGVTASAGRNAPRPDGYALFWGLPLALWQGMFFLAPLAFLVVMTFWSVKNFRLEPDFDTVNWVKMWSKGYVVDTYLRTLGYAVLAAVVCSVLAFPAAYALAFKVSPATRRLGVFLLITPFFTSYVVRVYSWQAVISDNGILNTVFGHLGFGPVEMLNTLFGTVVGYLTLCLPLVILLQLFSLANVDRSLIEAAHNLGCGRIRTDLPGDRPVRQGGPDPGRDLHLHPLLRRLREPGESGREQAADAQHPDRGHGEAGQPLAARRGGGGDHGGDPHRGRLHRALFRLRPRAGTAMSLDRIIRGSLLGYVFVALGFVFVPIVISFIFSFNEGRFPVLPIETFSTVWYEAIWNEAPVPRAFRFSIIVGLSVAAISTFIGFATAYTDFRYRFFGKNVYLALALLPPTIPVLILGLVMLMFLGRVSLVGELHSVIFSHVVYCTPFAMALIRLRLSQMDPDLERAAWNLGANNWRGMLFVILPFTMPSIFAALFLTAAVSFDEFMIAFFVGGVNETLPVRVLNMMQGQVSPRINAVGSVVFAVSITLVILAQVFLLTRRGTGRLKAPV